MAKKPYRRHSRRFNLRRVRVIPQIPLSTLANVTVLTGAVTGSADGAYRAISISGTWSYKLVGTTEGPVVVGYAHSDYSVAEIKEALEIQNSINVGDKVAQEKAKRLVRIVGVFSESLISGGSATLNDGKPIKTRLNWFIPIGKAVNIFAYNDAGLALEGSSVIDMNGDLWVKDT